MSAATTLRTALFTAGITSLAWMVAIASHGANLEGRLSGMLTVRGGGDGPTAVPAPPRTVMDHPVPQPPQNLAVVRAPGAELVIPVNGVKPEQLADTFTQMRANGARVHDAIDIMAARGTPVVAAAPGQVEKLFVSQAGGNTIYIRSADRRIIHYYAHLDSYAPGLAEGQRVDAGQFIGTVGSSGNASPAGPHLHFAVWQTTPEAKWYQRMTAINPYPLLRGR